MATECELSVIVIPLVEGRALDALLDELCASATTADEILVVPAGAVGAHADDRVTWVAAPADASIPQRRALGLARARGAIVAFVEDTVRPIAGFCAAVRTLHAQHPEAAAIGGTVALADHLTPRQVALAALDYGRFLGASGGDAAGVPGNVMSFKRRALADAGDLTSDAFREVEIVARLSTGPGTVRVDPAMAATCIAVDPRGATPDSRFQHGRLYAGHRPTPGRLFERVGRAMAAPALAGVLARRALGALRGAGHPGIVRVAPHVAWMSGAWALGESVGYLAGPGQAERHWR
jgi:hypothetical protein